MNHYKLYLILILFFSVSCKDPSKYEELKMESKTLESQIKEIKITDNKKLDSLSKAITEESRKDANELVKILHSDNAEEVKKASMILLSIGDLAVTPMLDSLDPKNADNYTWEMDVVLSLYLQSRNKITTVLNSMLLDKRQLKEPDLQGAVEEIPASRRVCDEAYLMLRRLTAFKENEEDLMMNEKMFLDMTDDQRDKEIGRIKSSKEWISLLEHLSDEGEF
jgi:hypothetical protein